MLSSSSSYRIGIISDTQMVIFPDYRGPSAGNVTIRLRNRMGAGRLEH